MDKIVYIALEHRFFSYKGELYTKLSFPYNYWSDYLTFFDKVVVVARVQEVSFIDSSYSKVSGDSVDFFAMPYYVGVKEFIHSFPHLIFKSFNVVKSGNKFILRSGNISNLLWFWLMLRRKKYLREYPGNIYEGVVGFSGNSFKARILGRFLDNLAKLQAKYSCANSFVSQYCKDLYSSRKPSYIFSSFNSDEIDAYKTEFNSSDKKQIVSVGRIEGEKGHEDLIEAFSRITTEATLHIIGSGSRLDMLKKLSTERNLDIKFYGAITNREELFNLLASMDLFVIPSHTEGMPRSLLEAMTIGLPCIGSNVGGIPEVLDSKSIFEPKNITQCAQLIDKTLSNKDILLQMSERNKDFISNNYSNKVLKLKRIAFWSELYK